MLAALREAGLAELPVVVGGNIPSGDEAALRALGIAAVFGVGSDFGAIAEGIRAVAPQS